MATSFHVHLDYLQSVEIILAALRSYSDPDAEIIACGIERNLICVEDDVVTHVGGSAVNKPEPGKQILPTSKKVYPPLRLVKREELYNE